MTNTIHKLNQLLESGRDYFSKTSEYELAKKASPEKWSKKEILGHLIDSGINNLQRFTEIQFDSKPFKIRKYNQDELVKANNYQHSDTKEILEFWYLINNRIKKVMELQTEDSLNYKIEFEEGNISDLKFLMTDYVEHLEHHLNQIME
ncbi:hypothetical protein ACIVBQ_003095 [Tenacibaculum discolor]